jgi:hypothetical protein
MSPQMNAVRPTTETILPSVLLMLPAKGIPLTVFQTPDPGSDATHHHAVLGYDDTAAELICHDALLDLSHHSSHDIPVHQSNHCGTLFAPVCLPAQDHLLRSLIGEAHACRWTNTTGLSCRHSLRRQRQKKQEIEPLETS